LTKPICAQIRKECTFPSNTTAKFFVNTPALMEKRAKAQSQKDKHATKRKLDSNSKSTDMVRSKGKKKKVDDDDHGGLPIDVTYYIYRSGGKVAADDVLQKGPFHVLTSEPYASLLSAIASELPCRVEHIVKSKITWKLKLPKSADKLPLQNEIGYMALPVDEPVPWDTVMEPEPAFDYSELEAAGTSDSIEQQKIAFNKSTKDEREKLEEKYPISNYPNFPDIRVYKDSTTGFYFELNATRMGIWSSAMARGLTDENTPSASNFFDMKQRIKTVPTVPTVPVPSAASGPSTLLYPPAIIPGTPFSLSDILLASILSHGGGGTLAGLPNPNQVVAAPLPRPSQPLSAPAPHVKRHNYVYGLDDRDTILLNEVGWKRIHTANLRFKADLATGMHD
ncbi:hypothetical protein K438DRAFT_1798652, partial [Mycena galopus ATCC 62051]